MRSKTADNSEEDQREATWFSSYAASVGMNWLGQKN
jgi:hypothetical protein